jgi:hypothetical protein
MGEYAETAEFHTDRRMIRSLNTNVKIWLGGLDSNQDSQLQRLMYYRLYDLPVVTKQKLYIVEAGAEVIIDIKLSIELKNSSCVARSQVRLAQLNRVLQVFAVLLIVVLIYASIKVPGDTLAD